MQVTVSARELKQRLGHYLDAASRGDTVSVTKRGKVIAELVMPALTAKEKLDRLTAQGRATRGDGRRFEPYTPQPAKYSGTEIILADREDERP